MNERPIELFESFSPIAISMGLDRIRILKGSLKALDYPKYIRLLVNQEKRIFSIQVCSEDEKDSFKLSNWVLHNRNGFEISGKQLIYLIFEFMNWDTNVSYKVYGIKGSTQNALFFNLEEATKIMGDSND